MPSPEVLRWAADSVGEIDDVQSLHEYRDRDSGSFRVQLRGITGRDLVLKVPVPDWIGGRLPGAAAGRRSGHRPGSCPGDPAAGSAALPPTAVAVDDFAGERRAGQMPAPRSCDAPTS